jgi:hypothetical protein
MIGFMYRRAVAIKDFGERHHLAWLIRMGLAIQGWASKFSIKEGLKITTNYKTADILDWIFTGIYTALAFWADWRIGMAFIAYDLSRVFEGVKDELRAYKRIERFLKNNRADGGNDGTV